jgi:F-type H+-transporting ATPase subunit delta
LVEDTLQAKRYSQAIFEIARQRNEFDKWRNDLQQISDLAGDSDFEFVMDNPRFTLNEKTRLLKGVVQNLGPMALNLVYLLSECNRFAIIKDIFEIFQELVNKYRGIEIASITSAVELNDSEISQITESLSKSIGKKIIPDLLVDQNIIGGLVIRAGGKIIDGSTRNQLMVLKNEIAGIQ